MLNLYRRLLEIMTPAERRKFWILTGITFFLSVLEAASVVSILPFLHLLSNPQLIVTQPLLAWVYGFFGFHDITSFQIAAGVFVFAITVVGLITKAITVWITTRFAMMRSYSLSARLLASYLHQPYEWFQSRHSSELGTTILTEADRLVREGLLPAIRILPELFSVVLLVIALCTIEPWIAIGGAALLGGVYGGIFLVVRHKLTALGATQKEANRSRFHVVQEATGGIRELKILGLERGFLGRFRTEAFKLANAQTASLIISALPRFVLEAVAFGGMILLVLVLLVRNGSSGIEAIIPTLGLMAAVGIRLLPALQQIYMRGASLKTSGPIIDKIHSDIISLAAAVESAPDRTVPTRGLKERLELRDVHYRYPGSERSALRGLNLTLQANTTVGIVGGSGAGKTTLIDVVLGLLSPERGQLTVDGLKIDDSTRVAWQNSLGYVPQTIFLSDGTVAENIAFGQDADRIDMGRVESASRTAALHDFVMSELPSGYDTRVGERGTRLSGGQRQRIGIARALYHNPSTLVFDEATSALDTLTEAAVMDAVHSIAGQKTIVIIAHRLSTVRNCDEIILMRDGRVAATGKFDQLVERDLEFRSMAADLAALR